MVRTTWSTDSDMSIFIYLFIKYYSDSITYVKGHLYKSMYDCKECDNIILGKQPFLKHITSAHGSYKV